jgi:hypothetical protein
MTPGHIPATFRLTPVVSARAVTLGHTAMLVLTDAAGTRAEIFMPPETATAMAAAFTASVRP